MLQDSFNRVYTKFKMHFYQKLFEKLQERETSLTTVETFCMEIIYALDKPTVAEFAEMADISSPNAAYKINNLVKKGYLKKVQSTEDKREYHLEVTQKYIDYYNISNTYLSEVMERIQNRFSPEELETLERMLDVISNELMPEVKY
ncbi:MAG: MarR family winged helix-turn-helix transcriptional regulator [Clostridia bacterium]|nr:MarR family winged helix-turn-helix transcriptional regulator [Clostridia bacterium]MDY4741693.1 MarR family winged helix-turn-helix transcriptional regulator [Lachnospira sp.]